MRSLLFALSILCCIPCFSQSEKAKEYIDTLCSPYFFGRGYAKDGVNKAADYLAAELERKEVKALFGNSYFQVFEHNANIFTGKNHLEIAGKKLKLGADYIQRGSSGSFKGELATEKIVLPEALDKGFMRNLFNKYPATSVAFVVDKSNLDKSKDSELMLTMLANSYVIIVTGFDKLTWSVSTKRTYFPVIETTTSIEEGASVFIQIEQELKIFRSKNVAAMVPAEKPSKDFVFLTAHYDHLGGLDSTVYIPGANDNASGTAMLLDMMDYFKANPHPTLNVGFIFFAGEEMGLLGSKHYVDNPAVALANTKFVLNLDLMGSGDKGFAVVNGSVFPDYLAQLKAVNSQLAEPFTTIKVRGEAANSDHYWFSKNGIPAFFIYTMGGSSAYHDIYDIPEIITLSRYPEVFELLSKFIGGIK